MEKSLVDLYFEWEQALHEDHVDVALVASLEDQAADIGVSLVEVADELVITAGVRSLRRYKFNSLLHPRSRDGRFIRIGGWVDFSGGGRRDHRGQVVDIRPGTAEGVTEVQVQFRDSSTGFIGRKVWVAPDDIKSAPKPKAKIRNIAFDDSSAQVVSRSGVPVRTREMNWNDSNDPLGIARSFDATTTDVGIQNASVNVQEYAPELNAVDWDSRSLANVTNVDDLVSNRNFLFHEIIGEMDSDGVTLDFSDSGLRDMPKYNFAQLKIDQRIAQLGEDRDVVDLPETDRESFKDRVRSAMLVVPIAVQSQIGEDLGAEEMAHLSDFAMELSHALPDEDRPDFSEMDDASLLRLREGLRIRGESDDTLDTIIRSRSESVARLSEVGDAPSLDEDVILQGRINAEDRAASLRARGHVVEVANMTPDEPDADATFYVKITEPGSRPMPEPEDRSIRPRWGGEIARSNGFTLRQHDDPQHPDDPIYMVWSDGYEFENGQKVAPFVVNTDVDVESKSDFESFVRSALADLDRPTGETSGWDDTSWWQPIKSDRGPNRLVGVPDEVAGDREVLRDWVSTEMGDTSIRLEEDGPDRLIVFQDGGPADGERIGSVDVRGGYLHKEGTFLGPFEQTGRNLIDEVRRWGHENAVNTGIIDNEGNVARPFSEPSEFDFYTNDPSILSAEVLDPRRERTGRIRELGRRLLQALPETSTTPEDTPFGRAPERPLPFPDIGETMGNAVNRLAEGIRNIERRNDGPEGSLLRTLDRDAAFDRHQQRVGTRRARPDEDYEDWRTESPAMEEALRISMIGSLEEALLAAIWDPDLHPRGRDGRFINVKGLVKLFDFEMPDGGRIGESRGKVLSIKPDKKDRGHPDIEVELPDGKRVTVKPEQIASGPETKAKLDVPDNETTVQRLRDRVHDFALGPKADPGPTLEELGEDIGEEARPIDADALRSRVHGDVPDPMAEASDPQNVRLAFGSDEHEEQVIRSVDEAKAEGIGTRENPIVTSDPLEAVKALHEDMHVRLVSENEVSVMLDEIAAIANEAKEMGDKAPDYDFCKITVPGTSLFCAESKGIPRIEMPQLSGVPTPGSAADALPKDDNGEVNIGQNFVDFLTRQGINVEDSRLPAANLKASQNQLVGTKVAGMMKAMESGNKAAIANIKESKIFVTSDGYVVDGHHRWAAVVGLDIADGTPIGDETMPVRQIDMDITSVLRLANEFASDFGIPPKGGGPGASSGPGVAGTALLATR